MCERGKCLPARMNLCAAPGLLAVLLGCGHDREQVRQLFDIVGWGNLAGPKIMILEKVLCTVFRLWQQSAKHR